MRIACAAALLCSLIAQACAQPSPASQAPESPPMPVIAAAIEQAELTCESGPGPQRCELTIAPPPIPPSEFGPPPLGSS